MGDEVHSRNRSFSNNISITCREPEAGSREPERHLSSNTPVSAAASDAELLAILAELAREVSSVLDLDELLEKIPQLISRLTNFTVFSVYLLDEKREELSIAYAVGYPAEIVKHFTLRVGQGTVGTAVAEQRPILLNDVHSDPRYLAVVPGAKSQLAVPLRNKGQVIGALNLLSDQLGAFTERDEWILRQFGAHVAQAITTARLFESEREYSETLETLAEIGREMSAILDPDELLTRLAHLIKRVIDYSIFGIALLNEDTQTLEMKVAIEYGDDARAMEPVKLGEGLVGYAGGSSRGRRSDSWETEDNTRSRERRRFARRACGKSPLARWEMFIDTRTFAILPTSTSFSRLARSLTEVLKRCL